MYCWHLSVSEDNGFAPWSLFRGRAATATVAVEPNPQAAGLLAGGGTQRLCRPRYPMLPSLVCAALHLVLLFQFLFYFDRCRFSGQPPHISVSSQGFKVGRFNIASPEVAFADIFIPESWSTSGSWASGKFTIQLPAYLLVSFRPPSLMMAVFLALSTCCRTFESLERSKWPLSGLALYFYFFVLFCLVQGLQSALRILSWALSTHWSKQTVTGQHL